MALMVSMIYDLCCIELMN